jgi:hypothetical protein
MFFCSPAFNQPVAPVSSWVLKVKTPEPPEEAKEPNQVEAETEAGRIWRIWPSSWGWFKRSIYVYLKTQWMIVLPIKLVILEYIMVYPEFFSANPCWGSWLGRIEYFSWWQNTDSWDPWQEFLSTTKFLEAFSYIRNSWYRLFFSNGIVADKHL